MADTVITKPNTQWTSEESSTSTSFTTTTTNVSTQWSTTSTNVNSTHGINTTNPNSTWQTFAVLEWGDAKLWGSLQFLWGTS
jgi:hypothetical protein